ncbi:MAG: ribose-5-phosphate isomerase [Patescibacteria group bacterium]|nr:MAG: ribose-5-phosphate isomerase [Patescibacteria group bacterium]
MAIIYLGADHRGFKLKEEIKRYLQTNSHTVFDLGNHRYQADDDFVDFSQKVAEAVLKHKEAVGIVFCGSGVGVDIACNRFFGIRSVLGFNKDQIAKAVADDHCNVLSLAADYLDKDKAVSFVNSFLSAEKKTEEKYLRRIAKLDKLVR